jgi:cyanate permease
MQMEWEQPRLAGSQPPPTASGVLGKALTLIVGTAVLVAGFMLSMVVFALLAAIALVAWGYLWWKTRDLRRETVRAQPAGGRIIEGEVIRDAEVRDEVRP